MCYRQSSATIPNSTGGCVPRSGRQTNVSMAPPLVAMSGIGMTMTRSPMPTAYAASRDLVAGAPLFRGRQVAVRGTAVALGADECQLAPDYEEAAPMSTADPNVVIVTGENPFIRLSV